jgi:nucleoside-diphosphate-sugar epimerase
VYGPGDREILPLFRWLARGIAPLLGSRDARFALLYVEDLAEAVVQWLDCPNHPGGPFELHDGTLGGYAWGELVDAAARVFERRVISVPVPVALLKIVAGLNLAAARVFGYAPILTMGKVRELRHPNWVCDNAGWSRETGWAPQVRLDEGLRRTLGICS